MEQVHLTPVRGRPPTCHLELCLAPQASPAYRDTCPEVTPPVIPGASCCAPMGYSELARKQLRTDPFQDLLTYAVKILM